MDRAQCKEVLDKYLAPNNFDGRRIFRHILDSLGAIEKRLSKMERPKTFGPIEIPKPEIKFHLDDEEIERIKAIVAEKKMTSSNDDLCTKDCDNCGECSKSKYRTMAEHISDRPEGMTEDEARQDFIERCLANLDKLEVVYHNGWDSWWLHNVHTPIMGEISSYYRLPIDDDGELPDYPLLRCPDVTGRAAVRVDDLDNYQYMCGPFRWTRHKTRNAARAMANKLMRERFGVKYGEE